MKGDDHFTTQKVGHEFDPSRDTTLKQLEDISQAPEESDNRKFNEIYQVIGAALTALLIAYGINSARDGSDCPRLPIADNSFQNIAKIPTCNLSPKTSEKIQTR